MTRRVGALFAAGIEEAGYNSPIIYRPTKAREEPAPEATSESEKSTPSRLV